ncbi:MAG TPA: TspO/MBR family protein [Gemmatimonadales bacterium]|nr:TspO/MBR family protein [Gemmatimonadales bacterium]
MSSTSLVVPIAFAAGWTVLLGLIGALATTLGPWYYALRKPSWQPPDWAFGPAWTTIFLCAATAFVLAWRAPGSTPDDRTRLVQLWLLNAVLNVLWSVLFFRWRRPDWAVLEILPLWLSIIAMAAAVASRRPSAAWLLAPYLLWVSFAAVLNATIVRLNGPFGR